MDDSQLAELISQALAQNQLFFPLDFIPFLPVENHRLPKMVLIHTDPQNRVVLLQLK